MTHLWGVEQLWDNGQWRLLWSGWDHRWDGPNYTLLPILFRTREAGREWVREHRRWRMRIVRVTVECQH